MDFEHDDDVLRFREELRVFLATELSLELEERVYRTGVSHDEAFVRALATKGWILADFSPFHRQVFIAEMVKTEAPMYAINTAEMVCAVLRAAGSEKLQNEIIPKVKRGEVTIALGQTEPGAGSDVASIQTRARRDGDAWVIDGQKMFTTNAHVCDFVFLLARTDPDAPRHTGLTTFLVPLDASGIEVQAIGTLSGERTNITYYDEVRISDDFRIGEVNRGWETLMLALQDEHSAGFTPHLLRVLEHAETWARDSGWIDEEETRLRLARAATAAEVATLLENRVAWMESRHEVPRAEGPMAKLFGTEAVVRFTEDIHELVGPDALRSRLDPSAIEDGAIDHGLRLAVGTTIYAGTSEIQRNLIAQFACGLPRG